MDFEIRDTAYRVSNFFAFFNQDLSAIQFVAFMMYRHC